MDKERKHTGMLGYNPVSTYRLQFNGEFRFSDARHMVSYLGKLGVKTVYASPVFQSQQGSTHGYDVTDPSRINPEIGTDDTFESLVRDLHSHKIGWLQDIVPNHMAYSSDNPWIFDLLEKGNASPYFRYFDLLIQNDTGKDDFRVLLPFFGQTLSQVIRDMEIKVVLTTQGFMIQYFDDQYPLSRKAYDTLLRPETEAVMPANMENLLNDRLLPGDWDKRKKQLINDYQKDKKTLKYIDACLKAVNENPDKMTSLLNQLSYRPVYWRETEKHINFRRFFTINSLICTNIQEEQVFADYHRGIAGWMNRGLVDGLRVDHVDGLYDPGKYLKDLRNLSGDGCYLTVEKILEQEEELEEAWPVQGSTGYDFLGMVNNLFTDSSHAGEFESYYKLWADELETYRDLFIRKKQFILYNRLNGELDYLTRMGLSIPGIQKKQFKSGKFRDSLAAFLIHCPVYKLYHPPSAFTEKDRTLLDEIFAHAFRDARKNQYRKELKALKVMLLSPGDVPDTELWEIDAFFRRCMQFTGALMAKGIEDTAFYSFNQFIAHNEVGDTPGIFGISVDEFHVLMKRRLEKFPLTMNATSTHDTKRGEDARARLLVISEMPEKWISRSTAWKKMNQAFKSTHGGRKIPSTNDEYLIYQSLLAHCPMDETMDHYFRKRFKDFLIKSLREGKVNSSWSEPDEEYENKLLAFVDHILSNQQAFFEDLMDFVEEIKTPGMIRSLSQLILKNTVPGVPDTYQGSERWNLSMVDPDNRGAVDYYALEKDLDTMIKNREADPSGFIEKLWEERADGRIKQWMTKLTLQLRTDHENLFLKGSYEPISVKGRYKHHVLAFYRRYRDDHLLIVVPLYVSKMPMAGDWEDTRIKLPEFGPHEWENILTNDVVSGEGKMPVNDVFQQLPFGILKGKPFEPPRRAGVLMHISSLPGKYGIGDFGEGARWFADFLARTGQRYWQILPLSVSNQLTGYSPYSSLSAFAGNILFTDPEELVRQGLLDKSQIHEYEREQTDRVDYVQAEQTRQRLLDLAYRNYKKLEPEELKNQVIRFKEDQAYWLRDYALFRSLTGHFNGFSWDRWPEEFRDRKKESLEAYAQSHEDELEKIIFQQFLFLDHWKKLKKYANGRGIDIFGDIPIYIDYNSADVWAHPEVFRLNPDKTMEAVAGVPPDYFNENGQLWGMPLFDWEEMEKYGYEWWMKRIEKNLDWVDLLRLDHFRGFSAYWEVPSDHTVALHGKWTESPGTRFFDKVMEKFPGMPLVAEDLGQIDQDVYDLRDHYDLPGMKVIQFGFGEHMPFLQHVPNNHTYNSIAYTGTHDNNTMKGWFRQEADKDTLKRIHRYTGIRITQHNCHKEFIRLAYASPAKLTIIPMQDWLGLDEKARMNFPSTTSGNWLWRLTPGQIQPDLEKEMIKKVKTFGRY